MRLKFIAIAIKIDGCLNYDWQQLRIDEWIDLRWTFGNFKNRHKFSRGKALG